MCNHGHGVDVHGVPEDEMAAAGSLIGFSDLEPEVNDKINESLMQANKVAELFQMLRSDFNLFKGETDRSHQTSLDVMRLEHKTALSQ